MEATACEKEQRRKEKGNQEVSNNDILEMGIEKVEKGRRKKQEERKGQLELKSHLDGSIVQVQCSLQLQATLFQNFHSLLSVSAL